MYALFPTAYGRLDNQLFVHGSPASRMLKSLQQGIEVYITVTLTEGTAVPEHVERHLDKRQVEQPWLRRCVQRRYAKG